jgi:nicotinate-nucleotide adenylyltransferase
MHRSAPVRFGRIKAKSPLVGHGQRIGLLGGSFNPPHEAHVLISDIAMRRLGLDAMWWLVTPGNPLKSSSDLAPLNARMAACRALAGHSRIRVSGLEAGLSTPFTAATLAYLKLRHPGVHFVWIMGADCLAQFHHWRQWRGIMTSIPIAVIDRPRWHLKALASPAAGAFHGHRWPETSAKLLPLLPPPAWTFLTGPLLPHSSTAIRVAKKSQSAARQTTPVL